MHGAAAAKRSKRRKHAGGGPKTHLLAELIDCDPDRLQNEQWVHDGMIAAAERAGATVVDSAFHEFPGGGISGFVHVKESHLSVHTWPEYRYAAVDVFLCGRTEPDLALKTLAETLDAKRTVVTRHERGPERIADAGRIHDARAHGAAATAAGASTLPLSMPTIYAVTMVVAACSIVYELLLAQTLSALLGNTVLRYSITIGAYLGALGLGAILCGRAGDRSLRRLVRVEVALSALGGASVPLFYFGDALQRVVWLGTDSGSWAETLTPYAFLAFTHLIIVGIGLLSGFEIPLLVEMGERRRAGSTNRVLGVDYLGSLVGSVAFPLVCLRTFGLLVTAFGVALLNAVAAAMLFVRGGVRSRLLATSWAATSVLLALGLWKADALEQHFLKKFYYFEQVATLADTVRPDAENPAVLRRRSPYQTVDLFHYQTSDQWIYDLLSRKRELQPDYPDDVWLYLDREYQVFSGSDEFYHEWFVHAPIQAAGRWPRTVLVIGGGDGLVIREVLRYASVERVVHVDIDPVMLHLAETNPALVRMNGRPHDDPRVTLVVGDAFAWLRRGSERFDAVYVDVPRARDYNLSILYSQEFYSLLRRRLQPGGLLAMDAPDGSCGVEGSLWPTYVSTLHAAGFDDVRSFVSKPDLDDPRVSVSLALLSNEMELTAPLEGGGEMQLTPAQVRQYLETTMRRDFTEQEFILARAERGGLHDEWRDPGFELAAFGPGSFALTLQTCPDVFAPERVNSLFRPTLPELHLAGVTFP